MHLRLLTTIFAKTTTVIHRCKLKKKFMQIRAKYMSDLQIFIDPSFLFCFLSIFNNRKGSTVVYMYIGGSLSHQFMVAFTASFQVTILSHLQRTS